MPDSAAAAHNTSSTANPASGTPASQKDLSDLSAGRGPLASRIGLGKATRKRVPRAKLAACKIDARDPIGLLEASNVGRVPELIPIRYGRMIADPFAFYRGAAPLMAFDLANLPRSDIIVQLGGDAHLANFGLFASPERRILFGPNAPDDRRALFDRYEPVDVAIRVVGIGSVGTRCYEALFMADGECPLFLQLKEARTSVLEGYLLASQYPNHGQRMVNGQRLLQSASDIFLGWSRMHHTGNDFYVRQLRDMKGAFDFTTFNVEDFAEHADRAAPRRRSRSRKRAIPH